MRKKRKNGHRVAPPDQVTLAASPWDHGAAGPANRIGLTVEEVGDVDPETGEIINPNNVKRARRVDMLEVWHKRGCLTTRAFNMAEKLRDAFEATLRAPGWNDNDRVQASPKPDHAVAIQIDRVSAFAAIHKHVIKSDEAIIDACVLSGGGPQLAGYPKTKHHQSLGIAHLNAALERLADATSR